MFKPLYLQIPLICGYCKRWEQGRTDSCYLRNCTVTHLRVCAPFSLVTMMLTTMTSIQTEPGTMEPSGPGIHLKTFGL